MVIGRRTGGGGKGYLEYRHARITDKSADFPCRRAAGARRPVALKRHEVDAPAGYGAGRP